jgi:hypothetical protein
MLRLARPQHLAEEVAGIVSRQNTVLPHPPPSIGFLLAYVARFVPRCHGIAI